ncbi:hypothetical protein [Pyrobaculum neutrophilum]|uniref:Uncharacterized protein n=1 Tax=Pyrobaculum neutrophilum (strain DSM 2338 / JCM 9278 / NBRC 100436 / V24Sta) TaxID=444157 RepID=B1Y9G7_PYRNV|nr:hypothetical protein [Pyrobaculum neutrophilum]ACB40396.1 conserved hypothetical protein [Pyrobaculum neutrophilum V24Sta]
MSNVVLVRVGDRDIRVDTVEDLEKLCSSLKELLQGECQYHSWYIRIPPERLLALLRKAYVKYTQGVVSVGDVISEYLEENKLSKSLARTITPTLSSLGLASSGRFTSSAVEVGRLLYEGRSSDARERLRALALKNCVLKEILERINDCAELEKATETVLASYGKSVRFDELKYTVELLKMVSPRCRECDLRCATAETIYACGERIIQLAAPHIRELFEKLDISLLPEHLNYVNAEPSTYLLSVKGTAKQIGLILLGPPVEGADLQQMKNALARLDERVVEGVYEVYIKILPILEGDERCKSVKFLVEVVRGDLERVSKFVKPSF